MYSKEERIMPKNLEKCRAFVTIAEVKSFGESAKIMGISQPGISRMISDLEDEWGFKLFDRDRNGVSLTHEGEYILPAAKKLCKDADLLDDKIKSINTVETGHISIGVFSSVSTHWIPNIIKKFSDDHPDVKYELLIGNYSELREWVDEGRVDFAFMSSVATGDAVTTTVQDDELVAVIPTNNPYANEEVFPTRALAEFPFMLLKVDEDTAIDTYLRENGIQPDIRFQTWDDYTIMSMIEKGLCISILPSLILKRTPYRVCVKHLEKPAFRTICVGVGRGRELSVAAQEFLGYLKYRDEGL